MVEMTAEDYANSGYEHLSNGAIEDAINSFSQAIEADPNNEQFYLERATAYSLVGDIEAARSDYETLRQNYINQGGNDLVTLDYYQHLIEML